MGSLFDRAVTFENLHAAAWEVFRGKRDKLHAQRFFAGLEKNLFALQDELRTGSYRPGPYRTFWIHDPKPRLISAAPLRDRVVHHAVVRVVEPIFEKRFIHDSYACRPGKGNHRALRRFVGWARAHRYVLMLDVHRFFPSIDHEVLKAEIRRGLGDERLLRLLDTVIDGSNPQERVLRWFPGDDLFTPLERRRGLPIGNLTSQWLANVLLDRVDHLVKDRLRMKRYLRYVDDAALFHDDREVLADARAAIVNELAAMRLSLNARKSRLRQCREGLTFLGFVVTPKHVRLAQSAVRRARAQGRALVHDYARGQVDLETVRCSWVSWLAHVGQGDTQGLVRSVARGRVFRATPSAGSRGGAPCLSGRSKEGARHPRAVEERRVGSGPMERAEQES